MNTDIHSLVGAYALDAVDDLERRSFERHLDECESCRTEAQELRATAARLADYTWSVPPPRLRENVLTAITATPQLAPRTRTPREFRWRRLVAAAAVFAAVAGSGFAGYALHRTDAPQQQTTAADARITRILAAPDLVTRTQEITGGGRMTFASSRLYNAGVIVMAANGARADGRVYQLWTIRPSGAIASAGVLKVGQSQALQLVDGQLPVGSQVAVTAEPPGGSPQPTSDPLAGVKIT